jgi:glutathione synthase/RimK-type ligase-like ATP-grasp enzyme
MTLFSFVRWEASLRILIPTYSRDIHATAVAVALERKGHEPLLWHGADFPTRQTGSIRVTENSHRWQMHGVELDEPSRPFDVVWFRRPSLPVMPRGLYPGDREIATRAAEAFYRAIWQLVAPDAFWVNPVGSRLRSDSKPVQLIEAARIGFKVPPTLFSNDPQDIRGFLAENEGHCVYKSLYPAVWETRQGVAYLFTTDVTLDDLPDDDLLQASAGIFQRKLPKAYELRVTCLGERAIAAKLYSQENELARADWRRAFKTVHIESTTLPEDVGRMCWSLMGKLGILFGCFDFIVTPEGELYFLEVNHMGQFLWLEEGDPNLFLLDAFCEFLVQRRTDFSWQPSSRSVRFADVQAEAEARTNAATALHVDKIDIAASDRPPRSSPRPRRGARRELRQRQN